jgi:hypothetical protein
VKDAECGIVLGMDSNLTEPGLGEHLAKRAFGKFTHLDRLPRAGTVKDEILENLELAARRTIYKHDAVPDVR